MGLHVGLYDTAQNAGAMAAREVLASGTVVARPSWEELRDRAEAWLEQHTITLPANDDVGRALVRWRVALAYGAGYAYEIGFAHGSEQKERRTTWQRVLRNARQAAGRVLVLLGRVRKGQR